jgi:hypothetical protein
MPAGFTAITAAWQTATIAYGSLTAAWHTATLAYENIVAAWQVAGQAYGNLISIITAGWNALPAMMTDAVSVGISEALTAHGLASGTPYVPQTGLYMLHEGEAVIPASRNGGPTITLQFGDIHLSRGGRQEAEEFITAVESSIQSGRLRQAVQRATAGQV